MKNFFEHEGESVTAEVLKHVNDLCKDGFKQKRRIDDIKIELRREEEKLGKIQAELMPLLKDAGLTKIEIDGCGKVVVDNKISVKVPKEPADREAFFNYLKAEKMFEPMITVNSATLNSYYNSKIKEAKEEGKTDFKIPGLEPSGEWSKLRFK